MIYRETPVVEVREQDGEQTIEGLAIVFYRGLPEQEYRIATNVIERVSPDAKINLDSVVALWSHDKGKPLGRTRGKLSLERTKRGIEYKIKRGKGSSWWNDAVASIEDGDTQGSSFGAKNVRYKWTREGKTDIATIVEIDLAEISPTPLPAYSGSEALMREAKQWTKTQEIIARYFHKA